ncbi:MAG: hypothetical protein V1850_02775 [Candidatus Bathyarchaeota archaeon]
MSFQEKLREGLYDSEGRPRLVYARSYFQQFGLDENSGLKELKEYYREWRDFDEYFIFQKQLTDPKKIGEVERETIASKSAKRGNDVYNWRLDKRLRFLDELKSLTLFDPHSSSKRSNVIFATLTYDVNRSSVQEATETVGLDYNNWIRNLRKKFGRVSCFRCWKASKKGYLHIHVLLVFHDYEFKISFSQLKGSRMVYRVEEKEEFEKGWHSFVDVQAVRELRQGIRYVTKYLAKTRSESQIQDLTLALCWLFRKRTFAVSGDFLEELKMKIKSLGINRLVQINLQGETLTSNVEYVRIGFFSANRLGIDRNE